MNKDKNYQIDIIIPIYNAYEYVIQCVDSILNVKTNISFKLYLIDDYSPDKRISEYLNTINNDKIITLRNKENLGFVKTVNVGMNITNNDVILLNSDTIVTDYWLDKLVECAYSKKQIATVTPYTNSGTICSIPNFNEDNEISEEFTLEELSTLIERISLKTYVEIPTAVGFCMLIKRKVINEIGYFDEINFGKGYGEENEFCRRAVNAGYINVICDNCFIEHKGSMSFKKEKEDLINNNLKRLNDLHPNYNLIIQEFISNTQLKDLSKYIKFHLDLKINKKYNILYLIHNDIYEDDLHPRGGTEFHLKDLIENLDSTKYNFFIVYTNKNIINLRVVNEKLNIKFKIHIKNTINNICYFNNEYFEVINNIINHFNINLVHIQHLKGHPVTIIEELKDKFSNLNIISTVHDYYCLCPTINLLNSKDEYCNAKLEENECKLCIKKRINENLNVISFWRKNFKRQLLKVDMIITPSFYVKSLIEKEFDLKNSIIKVIEHGIDFKDINKSKQEITSNEKDEILRVAFLGGLAPYKGSKIAYEIIKKYSNRDDIKFYIIGNLGDKRLEYYNARNLTKFGRYNREDIVIILKKLRIDLIILPSIWPETFSYTLSEAWSANIPVLAYNMGAIGERIKKSGIGWAIEKDSNSISDLINNLMENRNLIDYEKNKFLSNNVVKDLKTMSLEYEEVYIKLLNDVIVEEADATNSNFFFYNLILNNNNNNNEYNDVIKYYEDEIRRMKNTIGWKILNRLRVKFPKGLNMCKKFISLIYK